MLMLVLCILSCTSCSHFVYSFWLLSLWSAPNVNHIVLKLCSVSFRCTGIDCYCAFVTVPFSGSLGFLLTVASLPRWLCLMVLHVLKSAFTFFFEVHCPLSPGCLALLPFSHDHFYLSSLSYWNHI